MLAILVGYYLHPPTAEIINALADYRRIYGLLFVVVASILAGAILPEIFVLTVFQRGRWKSQNFRNLAFNAPFWALDGILVDLMYRTLAGWFGATVTMSAIGAKICVDQLGYNPFFAAPYGIWGYAWKNGGFSWKKLRPLLTWQYYLDHAVPVLVATWAVWIPLMAIIYALPLPLQFPLFALALAFWVLMMTYMTNRFASNRAPELATVAVMPPVLTGK